MLARGDARWVFWGTVVAVGEVYGGEFVDLILGSR